MRYLLGLVLASMLMVGCGRGKSAKCEREVDAKRSLCSGLATQLAVYQKHLGKDLSPALIAVARLTPGIVVSLTPQLRYCAAPPSPVEDIKELDAVMLEIHKLGDNLVLEKVPEARQLLAGLIHRIQARFPGPALPATSN